MAKERESHHIAEEKFSTAKEIFDQASNAYMTLYYHYRWRAGHYRNDVKPREFDKLVGYEPGWSLRHLGKDVSAIDLNEKGGIIFNDDEDGYRKV